MLYFPVVILCSVISIIRRWGVIIHLWWFGWYISTHHGKVQYTWSPKLASLLTWWFFAPVPWEELDNTLLRVASSVLITNTVVISLVRQQEGQKKSSLEVVWAENAVWDSLAHCLCSQDWNMPSWTSVWSMFHSTALLFCETREAKWVYLSKKIYPHLAGEVQLVWFDLLGNCLMIWSLIHIVWNFPCKLHGAKVVSMGAPVKGDTTCN